MALGTFVERGAAQCDALVNRAAVADFSSLADHRAHGVVKEYALADDGAGVDFDAGEKTRDMRGKAPQPLEAMRPKPMCRAVQDDGMQAGVAGDDLPCAAGSRVAVQNALDIRADSGKHGD